MTNGGPARIRESDKVPLYQRLALQMYKYQRQAVAPGMVPISGFGALALLANLRKPDL